MQISVTGTVTDATTGEPLPGVNIVIKGTGTGTISDLNGNFTLQVNDKDIFWYFLLWDIKHSRCPLEEELV
jgi:restriction endonuclease S subunit